MTQAPIALIPLDERPVNTGIPADVAAIAGVELMVPGPQILPVFRQPGDTAALQSWLESVAQQGVQDAVVSLDTFVYGGLIPSRTSDDDVKDCLQRLHRLSEFHQEHPEISLSAVGLVMRASDSYSNVEEPLYWSQYGRELHGLGGQAHRQINSHEVESVQTEVPAEVVSDFEKRRLRNHILNLAAVEQLSEGTFDTLAITADDTAEWSAGSAEQQWLRHWMRLLPNADSILMYPGADEVGATLTSRALVRRLGQPISIRVECADPNGLDRIPPYENLPLSESIPLQMKVAGGVKAEGDEDLVLVVNSPDPARHDMGGGPPAEVDYAAAQETAELVAKEIAAGNHVALADLRFPNGADAELIRLMDERGLLLELEAYGGWNTAGNALGSTIALAIAASVGRKQGSLDESARRRALLRRLLDDYAYQSSVRWKRGEELFNLSYDPITADQAEHAQEVIAEDLRGFLKTWGAEDFELESVGLPWSRAFEVDLDLQPSKR